MKAILLVRVSTTVQELKEQEREVYELALKDGYTDADIIPICEKESAIKLKEEERLGLNRLKEVVASEEVKDVYIWEVSRLARTKKVLFSMEDYFVSKRIQVTFKAPNFFRLLKEDGTLDEGADMIFTIYAQLAESEMRTKKERFKRGKDARRREGYYVGGSLFYGYTVEPKTNKIIPHPEEAEIVQMIFNMFLTGKYSYRTLAKELQSMGIFTDKSYNRAVDFVGLMLRNKIYTGAATSDNEHLTRATLGNVYPALITPEMLEKCREITKRNEIVPKKKHNNIYFGSGILKCGKCAKNLTPIVASVAYGCKRCKEGGMYNMNTVDSVLWYCAAPIYKAKMDKKDESQKEYYNAQILLLSQKINVAQKEIEAIRSRAEKIEYKAYVEGTMDVAKADKFVAELNQKVVAKEKEVEGYNSQILSFQKLILEYSGEYDGEYIDDVYSITDDKVRNDIIHQCIKWAYLERSELSSRIVFLVIYDYLDNKHTYLINIHYRKVFTEFTPEGLGLKEAVGFEYLERFQRKPKVQKQKATKEDIAKSVERARRYRQRKREILARLNEE